MLNFRRLKRDFSPNLLKEGRELYDKGMVTSAKILHLDAESIRVGGQVRGNFDNIYEIEVEIDRHGSELIDSNCDCSYRFDCQHLSALLLHLEEQIDKILADYSHEADLDSCAEIDPEQAEVLKETLEAAVTKESARKGIQCQQEILGEYISAAEVLGRSPFFLSEESVELTTGELAVIVTPPSPAAREVEIHLALRLPLRSKPLYIPKISDFLDAARYSEPLVISGRRYFFGLDSFSGPSRRVLEQVIEKGRIQEHEDEGAQKYARLDNASFGLLLSSAYEMAMVQMANSRFAIADREMVEMPCLYYGTMEEPIRCSPVRAQLRFAIELLEAPAPRIFLKPMVVVGSEEIAPESALLLECPSPGLLKGSLYCRFPDEIRRVHLRDLNRIRDLAIPEPLFGTFIENSLPELLNYAGVTNREEIEQFVTLPFVGELTARCQIEYLDGELEARLFFLYDEIEVPAVSTKTEYEQIARYITDQGILARNLTEEQRVIDLLFQGFIFDREEGNFLAKSEKKIVEFMTEIVPRHQGRVTFECPENLLDQFIYDETQFTLFLKESNQIDRYEIQLKVDGHLEEVSIDLLWESISAKRTFIELERRPAQGKRGRKTMNTKAQKILVLDLERLTPIVQLFDEMGIQRLETTTFERPLWSLATVNAMQFDGLPVQLRMSDQLKEIQDQMLGKCTFAPSQVPDRIQATLRKYQVDGVHWLERLRSMHLNGILADDMGLGKTLQAIIAVTQHCLANPKAVSLVVCPTSLLYNWNEELIKFNPDLRVLVIDGTPVQRKKLLQRWNENTVLITSYSLLQKDIDQYEEIDFAYAILDEAQHIKNRGTRNAKSVKRIRAAHRLILTGTPIENSLEELWSLFDFLMPGLLSTYDRFVEKYIRNSAHSQVQCLDQLGKKVAPFILRRMKSEVLDDLPPVSEIVYHCHLSEVQAELYRSYAASAREELTRLVSKEGFEKVQIHVLATLTRLKQICCHPAIFAKETAEPGDSSKYDMLFELLPSLVEGGHKTVIFSQYTRMLGIMRDDLQQLGIRFAYLDGSSRNRLQIVKQFNEDPSILVFLVSLKAGGAGLNLVGADTVIHYDMWWNPAVENQATDRVHRLGQQRSVSAYKLVTLGTIEEKIMQLQKRKRGLVKKVVSCDEEAVSKLTWEEVLELLQT
jgi:SNF2 family DNA or RNA helicase